MQHQSKTILFALAALLLVSCGTLKPQTEAQYTRAIRNDMPFRVAELTLFKPDIYTFSCDGYVDLLPDYEVNEEGDMVVWRTSFVSMRQRQSPQVIWRDVVISKRHQRALCIDRLLRDNKTFGYVYVLQGETKACPKGYHWDVADHRLMLSVAAIFREMTDMSLEQLRVNNAADNQ